MKTVKDKIEEIRQYGYNLDFGYTFNLAFEVYKKIALNAGIVLILFVIMMAVLFVAVMGGLVGLSAAGETMTNFRINELSGVMVVLYVLGMATFTAIMAPFMAGIMKMAYCAHTEKEFSIGTAFDYYRGVYFVEIVIATFLLTILTGGINTAFDLAGYAWIGIIIGVLTSFFTLLTIPLIIFGNLKAIDAIRASFIVVFKRPFVILMLIIVAYLCTLVGLLGFCIGIAFTYPFMYAMYYSIYVHSVGIDETDAIDQIGFE